MTRRIPQSLIASACVVLLAMAGCARPASLPATATEVILPGEDQLTPPELAGAAGQGETPAPQDSQAAAVSTAAAPAETTSAAPAADASPSAEPAAPAATGAPVSTGSEFAAFRGRVTVDGPVPSLPPLKTPGDPTVAPSDQMCVANGIPDESIVMSSDGGLANVFVYAKRLPAGVKAPPAPTEPVVLNQKDCRFIPQALVFRAGQPLLMTNSDPVGHNVRTTAITRSLNETVAPNNTTGIAVTYKKGEKAPVQTRCDIHAWMIAWHFPLDHPYATVTDANGNFEIADLPPGDWEFVVWHGRAKDIERSFKFKAAAGQAVTQDFSVPAAQVSQ